MLLKPNDTFNTYNKIYGHDAFHESDYDLMKELMNGLKDTPRQDQEIDKGLKSLRPPSVKQF